ncbi:MAG: 2-oxoacid:acceptor oxidoreductase family protein [Patescibacteria group bacterium]
MAKILEIRWHGRGGQGAKTGSALLGEAIVSMGRYVQAFPDYGPERMGAPMRAYNRISDEPISIHCGVTAPEVVLVLDPTLLGKVDVTQGLPEDGTIIVNTAKAPGEIRSKLGLKGRKVYTVDADRISLETIGRSFPNTPMLGALIKTTEVVPIGEMLESTRHRLTKKFRSKPEAVEGNIKAIERAYQEVRSE